MEKNTGRLLTQANHQLTRHFDQFAKPFDLTGMQMSIIDFLSHDEKVNYFQQDIEKEFNIQRSTTTVLLQRMEKKGLIYRQTSAKDARQKSVHLTDKARAVEEECRTYFKKQEEDLARHFTVKERASFEAVLHYYINKN